MLIALREGETNADDFRGIEQLRVGGVDAAAAQAILDRRTGGPAAGELASKLWEATGGNPLAMLEIARLLTDDQLKGREQVEGLPAAVTVEEAFLRRVGRLEEQTQRALLVAAAAGTERRRAIDSACRVLDLSGDALSAAEREGLVVTERGWLRFHHPLVRSAVYRTATELERREAHRALAAALLGEESRRERVWHESEAAAGPDEAIASSLEEAAVAATQQNAPELAARSYERAAHLTVPADVRGRRLLRAAQQWQLAGKAETALGLLDESLHLSGVSSRRTEIEELRGRAEAARGQIAVGNAILLREAARVERHDPATAVRLMSDACMYTWMSGDTAPAVTTAEHCYALGTRVGSDVAVWAGLTLGCSRLFQGERASASRLLLAAHSPPLARRAADRRSGARPALHLARGVLARDGRVRGAVRSRVGGERAEPARTGARPSQPSALSNRQLGGRVCGHLGGASPGRGHGAAGSLPARVRGRDRSCERRGTRLQPVGTSGSGGGRPPGHRFRPLPCARGTGATRARARADRSGNPLPPRGQGDAGSLGDPRPGGDRSRARSDRGLRPQRRDREGPRRRSRSNAPRHVRAT